MTQNEYDKWYRELNETQKEVTDEFFAWKEKASKGMRISIIKVSSWYS